MQCALAVELQQHVLEMFLTSCQSRIQTLDSEGAGGFVGEEQASVGNFKQRDFHTCSVV